MSLLLPAPAPCALTGSSEISPMGAAATLGPWGRGVRGSRREDDGGADGGGAWAHGGHREDRAQGTGLLLPPGRVEQHTASGADGDAPVLSSEDKWEGCESVDVSRTAIRPRRTVGRSRVSDPSSGGSPALSAASCPQGC